MARKRLFSGAANGNGTALDMGVGAAWDKLNYVISVPGTVTAHTIQLRGSADNITYVTIVELDNLLQAEGWVRVIGSYRYLRATLANYAGSGNVVLDVKAGKAVPQS